MAKPKRQGGRSGRAFIGGKHYVPLVLLIHTKDEHGRPALCKVIPDDHTIDLAGREEFMVGYVPEHMMAKNRKSKEHPA